MARIHISLLIALICFIQVTYAQTEFPLNEKSKEVEYSLVMEIDKSKDDLYLIAREWLAHMFKDSKDVIQFESQEAGKIVGKGNLKIDVTGFGMGGTIHQSHAGRVYFDIEVGLKDGKYRVLVKSIVHDAEHPGGAINNAKPKCGGMRMTKKTWYSIQAQANEKIVNFIDSSIPFFGRKSLEKDDDW